MSKATICDRCKKILDCSPSAKIAIDFYYNGWQEFELCEDCKIKLVKFIAENKEGGQ